MKPENRNTLICLGLMILLLDWLLWMSGLGWADVWNFILTEWRAK